MKRFLCVALTLAACGDDAEPARDTTTSDATVTLDSTTTTTADTTASDADPDTTPARAPDRTRTILTALGATPCASEHGFSCATIQVPLDHAHPGDTIPLAFAVRPATTSPPRGMLLNIAGGPGDSGLEYLDDYGAYDGRFADEFDIVYFDLRGVGGSDMRECPEALLDYYEGGLHVSNATSEDDLADRAEALGAACIAEMGLDATKAALYSTAQAAEDIESLRAALEHDTMRIYGLSYGTQLGQIYAAAHPDRVDALLIDGVVDLTSTLIGFDEALARASNTILEHTFAVCDGEPDCSAALGGKAGDAFEEMRDTLPVDVSYSYNDEDFTYKLPKGALDVIASAYMGSPDDRRAFLDLMIAVVTEDDWESLLYAYFDVEGRDYDDVPYEPEPSEAVYFLVTCADYGKVARAPYLAAGQAFWDTWTPSAYYGDSPCIGWPVETGSAPSVSTLAVPLMLINAEADNLTPHEGGAAVAQRNPDAAVIEVSGGEHVMYGWGNACIDDAASAFLLDLTKPATRPLACEDVYVAE